jgi:hypothetical protein
MVIQRCCTHQFTARESGDRRRVEELVGLVVATLSTSLRVRSSQAPR